MHSDGSILVQDDPAAVERLHGAEVVELERAVVLRLDDWLFERLAGSSTDVERPHRQLRAGFTNRLRRDNTHRFAELHVLTGRQVASITHGADSASAFARKDRANLQAFHADLLDRCGNMLVDELV